MAIVRKSAIVSMYPEGSDIVEVERIGYGRAEGCTYSKPLSFYDGEIRIGMWYSHSKDAFADTKRELLDL